MREIKPRRMLVILAHPDDESFAVGGTLAKYAQRDVRVILLCATRGEAGISGVKPEEAGDIRERELMQDAEHLGSEVYFLGNPDGVSGHPDHVTVSQIVPQAYDLSYRKGLLLYIHPSEATALGCGIPISNTSNG